MFVKFCNTRTEMLRFILMVTQQEPGQKAGKRLYLQHLNQILDRRPGKAGVDPVGKAGVFQHVPLETMTSIDLLHFGPHNVTSSDAPQIKNQMPNVALVKFLFPRLGIDSSFSHLFSCDTKRYLYYMYNQIIPRKGAL